ncbi:MULTISPECIES: F0F1 ATP synthase subunit delta [Methylomicrobium]|uniref:F0F1-type ATP synthase, beta subunit n=1 Tax=Methylomicrobium album BG8 TaxID=686340 RepID=H8GIS5_METAL|nr:MULTISPECIES: F0F1 ATP synthase subunit delta [Methylomicrobium]EIC30265.1 F0F1-type ATP synthase, beta subunit [Methylomicrobium album BG8]
MQLDWTTFILEILNFLVLVWILKRFLYRPVLDLLAARQQTLREAAEHAQKLCEEAETLRLQYESRLADWQRECENNRRQLSEELALARTREMDNIKKALAAEEEKLHARNEKLLASRESVLARSAVDQAYGQAAAMLNRMASPQLTHNIAGIFLEDVAALNEADRSALRKAAASLSADSLAAVVSAHPLDQDLQAAIRKALSGAAGQDLNLDSAFSEDPSLIAGLRAIVGECQMHANLADELAFFKRQANHAK